MSKIELPEAIREQFVASGSRGGKRNVKLHPLSSKRAAELARKRWRNQKNLARKGQIVAQ